MSQELYEELSARLRVIRALVRHADRSAISEIMKRRLLEACAGNMPMQSVAGGRLFIVQHGCMAVYGGFDSFVVIDTRARRCIQEFKHRTSAVKWAKEHANG